MPAMTNLATHSTVRSNQSEVIIRASVICHAAGSAFPTHQLVHWMEHRTEPYDNTLEYWQPYQVLDGGTVLIASWARGAYGYIKSAVGDSVPAIEALDPTIWHAGLAADLRAHAVDVQTASMIELMDEQTDLNGYWGSRVQEFHDSVRRAIDSGKLITDAAKARRRLAKIPTERA